MSRLAQLGGARPWVFHIHGAASMPASCVLPWRDYQQLSYGNVSWRESMRALVRTRRLLFIGYSMVDPDVLALLEELNVQAGGNLEQPRWWRGTPDCAEDGTKDRKALRRLRRLQSRFGVRVVDDDHHDLLEPILHWLATPVWLRCNHSAAGSRRSTARASQPHCTRLGGTQLRQRDGAQFGVHEAEALLGTTRCLPPVRPRADSPADSDVAMLNCDMILTVGTTPTQSPMTSSWPPWALGTRTTPGR